MSPQLMETDEMKTTTHIEHQINDLLGSGVLSHDTAEHDARVELLAERVRNEGIDLDAISDDAFFALTEWATEQAVGKITDARHMTCGECGISGILCDTDAGEIIGAECVVIATAPHDATVLLAGRDDGTRTDEAFCEDCADSWHDDDHLTVHIFAQHTTSAGRAVADPHGDDTVTYKGTRAEIRAAAKISAEHAKSAGAGADLYHLRVARSLREAAK